MTILIVVYYVWCRDDVIGQNAHPWQCCCIKLF